MKWSAVIFAAGASALLLTGCQSPNGMPDNTGTGALMGGAFGALLGAAAGGPEHGGAGALIGAAAGMIAGGAVGHAMDQQQAAALQSQAPQTYVRVQQGQPLHLSDIEAMAKAGVSDEVIISQIQSSHTVFHLSSADIIALHQAGVSDHVINFMINTPNTVGASAASQNVTVVQQAPPPAPPQPVLAPPGPGYVWVRGEWDWNDGWIWAPGYWVVPPYPNAVWIHGDWDWERDGWHHHRGHWR